jgi:hypothetical protein
MSHFSGHFEGASTFLTPHINVTNRRLLPKDKVTKGPQKPLLKKNQSLQLICPEALSPRSPEVTIEHRKEANGVPSLKQVIWHLFDS